MMLPALFICQTTALYTLASRAVNVYMRWRALFTWPSFKAVDRDMSQIVGGRLPRPSMIMPKKIRHSEGLTLNIRSPEPSTLGRPSFSYPRSPGAA